jgi:drug/metabolite transporter (DMT)-like permease
VLALAVSYFLLKEKLRMIEVIGIILTSVGILALILMH